MNTEKFGFVEGKDFLPILAKSTGGRRSTVVRKLNEEARNR